MCGIGLLLSSDKVERKFLQEIGNLFISSLESRGPNDKGLWINEHENLCICHTRLSIQGLDSFSSQPMFSSKKNWLIAYNGEVYNKKLLRNQLYLKNGKDINFKGNSDTEILVEYIQEFGIDAAINSIEGMFSLIAYNIDQKKLFFCGDRFGEKPLYFGKIIIQKKLFLFVGSDLNSIRHIEGRGLNYDLSSVAELLQKGYVSAPRTIYKEIKKIEQASIITIDLNNRDTDQSIIFNSHKYWDPIQFNKKDIISNDTDYKNLSFILEDLITDSVSLRLESDVPVACCLSSGVDSTIISAKANLLTNNEIKCFSLGFSDSQNNELKAAKRFSASLNLNHKTLELSTNESKKYFDDSLDSMTEPIGDSSIIPTYILSKFIASEGYKVALGGDGADEIFGGYRRHIYSSAFMELGLKSLQSTFSNFKKSLNSNHKYIKFLRTISCSNKNNIFYTSIVSFIDNKYLINLFSDKNIKVPQIRSLPYDSLYLSNLIYDQTLYLHNDILRKTDSASMANSLELRSPFLDSSIYEFGSFLNKKSKTSMTTGKLVLREIVNRLTNNNYDNFKKFGFGAPIYLFLTNNNKIDALSKYMEIICEDLNYIFDTKAIKKLFEKYRDNREYEYLIFSLCVFANWHKNNYEVLASR